MSTAIILCAGSSTRFSQNGTNKTLFMLKGKPIFLYSIEKFLEAGVEKIVLVVKKEEKASFEKFLKDENVSFAYGGKRRQDSVLNALKEIKDDEKILIHDGARPLISVKLIQKVFANISEHVCVVPVIPSEDALRVKKYGKLYSIDRKKVFRIQTPQGCLAGELRNLYEELENFVLYDDAAAFEMRKFEVFPVIGEKVNLKITTLEDIKLAESFLS